MSKNQRISRDVNGISVEQRIIDGFINATAMCVAHDKKIDGWFRTAETLHLFVALADDLALNSNHSDLSNLDVARLSASKYCQMFPSLIVSKRGAPEMGGGTWLHPDLAIQLAQWCSAAFALQVSRWVREWMTTGQNPMWKQADIDRVIYRDVLKDESRLRMTDQVKVYLLQIRKYDDQKYRGKFFAQVHDAINVAVVSETARQMRNRLGLILGKEIKESELIRDYFPALDLQRYIAMCEAAANLMIRDQLHPLTAVERAAEIVLPVNYIPKSIDFVEHINFVRHRLSYPTLANGNSGFLSV